jgi:haloalkane dehalogenase
MRAELVLPETAGEGPPPACAPPDPAQGRRDEPHRTQRDTWMQSRRPKRTDQLARGVLGSGGSREVEIQRGPYRPYARDHPGEEPAIVSLHWFPDNQHLYDDVVPEQAPRRVALFDFLGGGDPTTHWPSLQREQPDGRPGCGHRIAATLHSGARRPRPARDRAGLGPPRAGDDAGPAERVLLPDAAAAADARGDLAVFHPVVRGLARPPSMWFGGLLFRRTYRWQVDRFICDVEVKARFGPLLYEPFARRPTSHGAFFDLNRDLLSTLVPRNEEVPRLRRFTVAVRIVFGTADPYPNAGCPSASTSLCPPSELFLLPGAHHYLRMDEPRMVAQVVLAPDSDPSPAERKPGSGEAEARKYKKEKGRLPRGLARVFSVRVPGKATSAARSARPDGTIDSLPLPRTTSRSS